MLIVSVATSGRLSAASGGRWHLAKSRYPDVLDVRTPIARTVGHLTSAW